MYFICIGGYWGFEMWDYRDEKWIRWEMNLSLYNIKVIDFFILFFVLCWVDKVEYFIILVEVMVG